MNQQLIEDLQKHESLLAGCTKERDEFMQKARDKEYKMLELTGIINYLKEKTKEEEKNAINKEKK